jgi:hypothetical protein
VRRLTAVNPQDIRMLNLARPLLALVALGLLGGCSGMSKNNWSADNCTTDIAKFYTEQCNPYLSRDGAD